MTLEILRDAALLGLNIKGQEQKIRNMGDLQYLEKARKWILP